MGDGTPENKPGESPAAGDDDSFAYSEGYESLSHDSQRDVDSTSAGTATKAVTSAHQLQALYMSRIAVAVLLVLAITAAGVTTFFMADRTQQDHLDTQVGGSCCCFMSNLLGCYDPYPLKHCYLTSHRHRP
jgi:hypothetical protein